MPGPYRGYERLCGNKGMAAGRDESLPYGVVNGRL